LLENGGSCKDKGNLIRWNILMRYRPRRGGVGGEEGRAGDPVLYGGEKYLNTGRFFPDKDSTGRNLSRRKGNIRSTEIPKAVENQYNRNGGNTPTTGTDRGGKTEVDPSGKKLL